MIKDFLDPKEKKILEKLCSKILSTDVSNEYIAKSIPNLVAAVYRVMSEDYEHYNLASKIDILMDDIMCMDIPDSEKQEEIEELIARNLRNLGILADDLLRKVKSDEKEAEERGFCPRLLNKENSISEQNDGKLTPYQISKIDDTVRIDSYKSIVLIDVSGDDDMPADESNFNIYCINEYEIIWQVTEVGSKPIDDIDMFVYLGKNDKGEITADRFSGFEYKIDPDTGEAKRIGFHK